MPPRTQKSGRSSSCRARGAHLTLESLESRIVLSTATVPAPPAVSVSATLYSPTDILVQYSSPQPRAVLPGTTVGQQLSLVQNLYEINLSAGVSVAQAVAAYSGAAGVASAEPDYTLRVSDVPASANFSQQWALQNTGQDGGTPGADIGAVQAWNTTTGSNNIIVAVADTGIDYTHPDLYQNIWINQAAIPASRLKNLVDVYHDGYISMRDLNSPINQGPGKIEDLNHNGYIDAGDLLQPMVLNAQGQDTGLGGWVNPKAVDAADGLVGDLIGWNYSANNDNPMDANGHGTHVAGIIGGTGANGGTYGVDPNVQLMPVQFLDASGHGTVGQYIEALDYAVDHGAKIVNNSWTGADPSDALYEAVLNAENHGVIFVAAAGNDASNNDSTPVYPAGLSNYAAAAVKLNNVVSVAASDNNNNLASFSNYGASSVSLAAPGVNILSTLPGGGYGDKSGTSMATPMVAGALALVWGQHPDWTYSQVINQVLNSTTKEASLDGKVMSGGVLNVASAVATVQAASTPPIVVSTSASGPTANSLSSVQVTFDRAISLSTFTPDDVGLISSNGQRIAIAGVNVVTNTSDRTFIITFAVQTTPGGYTLYIGPNAKDLAGNRVTLYQGTFTITPPPPPPPPASTSTPPHVVSATASGPAANSLSTIQVIFDRAISLSTFTPDDVSLVASYGKRIVITGVTVVAGSGDKTFNITFAAQTIVGSYTVYVGSAATDLTGNHVALFQSTFQITTPSASPPPPPPASTSTPPHVVSATASGTTANSLSTIQMTFDRALSLSTFTPSDVSLITSFGTRPTITGVTVVAGSGNKTFNITFATQTIAGSYTVYVGSAATDLNGNHVAQYQSTFTITPPPPAPKPTASSYASSTAVAIPPAGRGVSLLTINPSAVIGTVTVKVDIKFPQVGTLYIHLQAPDGTNIVLSNKVGGSTANMLNTTFSDQATTSIGFATGTLSGGTYIPMVPLSYLAGKNMSGTWKLWVENSGGGAGTLLDWSMTITPKTT